MKIDQIIALTQAGWTKDEIMSLTSDEKPAEQMDPQPAEQPDEQPQPAEQIQQPASDERFKSLETKLDYVINRFNLMAVQQSQQPQQSEETLDDILASVVRGTKPDK